MESARYLALTFKRDQNRYDGRRNGTLFGLKSIGCNLYGFQQGQQLGDVFSSRHGRLLRKLLPSLRVLLFDATRNCLQGFENIRL